MTLSRTRPATPFRTRSARALKGRIAAPGDKSISHRALILGALADGETRITGLLDSEDVIAVAGAVHRFGARVIRETEGVWRVHGTGGKFRALRLPVDLGNSGTGVRLLMGAVAGAGGEAVFTGDSSLSRRPMERVIEPLRTMGAVCTASGGGLPALVRAGKAMKAIDYAPPIPSAQVKSAILLAALGAAGETIVREARATRDHTERMLAAFGAPVRVEADGAGAVIILSGPAKLTGYAIAVPGDPSSAAFALVAGLIAPDSRVTVEGVLVHPRRSGLSLALRAMGADLTETDRRENGGETIADMVAATSALRGADIAAENAADMIDEYPVLAVAAAFAAGTTRLRGLAELRAKESDRLAATAALLAANGVECRIEGDDLVIEGCGPGGVPGGGRIAAHGDHRIAMAAAILGLGAKKPVTVDDGAMIATSYPGFFDDMTALGAQFDPA